MDQTSMAFAVAVKAHADQYDKAGLPYIAHPCRVAARLLLRGYDEDQVVAGLLHDTVEDTREHPTPVTLASLREAGFTPRVRRIVDAVTRRPGEHPDRYYARIREEPDAVPVKDADLDDNSDPARLTLITDDVLRARLEAKYVKARLALHPEA
jgi:hypothetical protein